MRRELSTSSSIEEWHKNILQHEDGNDFIFVGKNISDTIWFTTNYTQFLCRQGNCEVIPLYGKLIKDLETFIYQVNYSLPVGYRLRTDSHALYDLLLNFETEPLRRVFFWNDADHLLASNRVDFEGIFESMILAGYLNRNGISTIKDDGSRYLVDQRNLFFFNDMAFSELAPLLEKKYYIPSIDDKDKETYLRLDFTIIELVD
jgi:hypothetical protein